MYILCLKVEFIEVSHSSVCKHGSFTGEHVHKSLYMTLGNCHFIAAHHGHSVVHVMHHSTNTDACIPPGGIVLI